jgi:hypothetical protein
MKKYYIRLSSKNDDVYNSEIATSVALMLTHTNYIKVFNGKNFNSQEIIVNKDFFIKSKKSLDKTSGKDKTLSKRMLFIDVQEDKDFDVINFFKKVIKEKEKNVGLYKFCKVSEVLNKLRITLPTSRTKEECIEDAKKYNSRKDWFTNSKTIFGYANKRKWVKECSKHFIKTTIRSKQECIEDAKKYSSKTDWWKKSNRIHTYALRNGWMDECTAHMSIKKKIRSKQECIEDAKKYSSRKEWKKHSKTIFGYSEKRIWMDECTAHMVNLKGLKKTKQECIEDAKKYNSRKEWKKHSSIFFNYAVFKHWYIECTPHFVRYKSRKNDLNNVQNTLTNDNKKSPTY